MKKLLTAAVAAALISGCATHSGDSADSSVQMNQFKQQIAERDAQIADLKARNAKQARTALAASSQAKQNSANTMASSLDLFPPDPQPGRCYARVLTPAKYRNDTERVLVREASERIETTEPVYEWSTDQITIAEKQVRLELVPAEYGTEEVRVIKRPASTRLVEVPARYDTVTERVLDKPAHTIWKRSRSPIAGALETTVDQSTGEVMCLVEVPASYKTVSKTVLVAPASVREEAIPAEYETVTRRVVVRPDSTREVVIPAKYETVKVQKLVTAAQEKRISIPEKWDTVTRTTKVADENLVWRDVVCDVNMTSSLASEVQGKLHKMGYYRGPLDGILGPQTLSAVNKYAAAKGLPMGDGYIATETIKALGLSI